MCQTLTSGQIRQYAAQAGFSGSALDTIVAIAQAESGGNTCAYNPNDPNGGSFGLVQINGAHFHSGGTSQACALDPLCSLKYAYQLYTAQGFSPWGTFTSGSYKQFLGGTNTSTSNTPSPSSTTSSSTSFDPTNPLTWGPTISTITSSSTWVHIGLFLGAIVFLIIGFAILISGEQEQTAV